MNLDSKAVVAMQNLINLGDFQRLASWEVTGLTLGAALELACGQRMFQNQGNEKALSLIIPWLQIHPIAAQAASALGHRGVRPVSNDVVFGSPTFEICPVPLEGQWNNDQWLLFQERFSRSLRNNGFSVKLAKALSKAMAEMTDNVTQHSGIDKYHQADAIVGFHTDSRCMTFAVADTGRGVLQSLRSNPKWHAVPNSADALAATINGSATSRMEETRGEGFRIVLNSLADYNGHLWFRSGSGSFTLDGRGEDRQYIKGFVPEMIGFQLSVTCSLDNGDCNMVV